MEIRLAYNAAAEMSSLMEFLLSMNGVRSVSVSMGEEEFQRWDAPDEQRRGMERAALREQIISEVDKHNLQAFTVTTESGTTISLGRKGSDGAWKVLDLDGE